VLQDPFVGTHVAPRPEAAQVRRPDGPVPARGVTGGIARLPVAPAPFPLPRGFFLRSEPFAAPFQEAHARLQDAVRDRPELRRADRRAAAARPVPYRSPTATH